MDDMSELLQSLHPANQITRIYHVLWTLMVGLPKLTGYVRLILNASTNRGTIYVVLCSGKMVMLSDSAVDAVW